MNYPELLNELRASYEMHASSSDAVAMKAYMKNRFEFFGIKAPVRRDIERKFLKSLGKPEQADIEVIARLAYQQPEREFQYFAIELARKYVKHLNASFIDHAGQMVTEKSWWDSVDNIASNIAGRLVQQHPGLLSVMDDWSKHENMWLQRTAILHQLRYKYQTDEQRLFCYCRQCSASKEFFLQKAIGWALREYSKIKPDAVTSFVSNNSLAPLSTREALKWLKNRQTA